MNMRFCDDCGTYLRKTKDGLWCPKCRNLIKAKRVLGIRGIEKRHSATIHVIDKDTGRPCEGVSGISKMWEWRSL